MRGHGRKAARLAGDDRAPLLDALVQIDVVAILLLELRLGAGLADPLIGDLDDDRPGDRLVLRAADADLGRRDPDIRARGPAGGRRLAPDVDRERIIINLARRGVGELLRRAHGLYAQHVLDGLLAASPALAGGQRRQDEGQGA